MSRGTAKTLFVIVVFNALWLMLFNPAFAAPDCNVVCEGHYVIDGIDTAADLEALEGCKSVTGNLQVTDSPLTSLEGLECLTHVGGYLYIDDNDSLTSLEGLEKLKSVGAELYICANDELCTSLALALRDQLLDAGGIGGTTMILGNDRGC